jgi:fructoselysine 6-kinase
MNKILALSTCCVDVFPEKGETKVGGNALNLATNCFGKADVYIMGAVGTDEYAAAIRKTADKYGINHERLYGISGVTASNKVYLTAEGDRYFKDDSWTDGVIREFRISPSDAEFIQSMDAVATTRNDGLIGEIGALRKSANFLLCYDCMDYEPAEFPQGVDLFFISGKDEHLPILRQWSREYDALFIITLGANGSVAFKDGARYDCAAVKVAEVVDTTGCGDSYQGAFICDYLVNKDILSAMQAGSKSAAVTLSFVGAIKED